MLLLLSRLPTTTFTIRTLHLSSWHQRHLPTSSRPQDPQIWEPKSYHHNGKPNQRRPLEGQSRQSSISAATPRLWFRKWKKRHCRWRCDGSTWDIFRIPIPSPLSPPPSKAILIPYFPSSSLPSSSACQVPPRAAARVGDDGRTECEGTSKPADTTAGNSGGHWWRWCLPPPRVRLQLGRRSALRLGSWEKHHAVCPSAAADTMPPCLGSFCRLWLSGNQQSQLGQREGHIIVQSSKTRYHPTPVLLIYHARYSGVYIATLSMSCERIHHSSATTANIAPRLYLSLWRYRWGSRRPQDLGTTSWPPTTRQHRPRSAVPAHFSCLAQTLQPTRSLPCQHVSQDSRKQECSSAAMYQPPSCLPVCRRPKPDIRQRSPASSVMTEAGRNGIWHASLSPWARHEYYHSVRLAGWASRVKVRLQPRDGRLDVSLYCVKQKSHDVPRVCTVSPAPLAPTRWPGADCPSTYCTPDATSHRWQGRGAQKNSPPTLSIARFISGAVRNCLSAGLKRAAGNGSSPRFFYDVHHHDPGKLFSPDKRRCWHCEAGRWRGNTNCRSENGIGDWTGPGLGSGQPKQARKQCRQNPPFPLPGSGPETSMGWELPCFSFRVQSPHHQPRHRQPHSTLGLHSLARAPWWRRRHWRGRTSLADGPLSRSTERPLSEPAKCQPPALHNQPSIPGRNRRRWTRGWKRVGLSVRCVRWHLLVCWFDGLSLVTWSLAFLLATLSGPRTEARASWVVWDNRHPHVKHLVQSKHSGRYRNSINSTDKALTFLDDFSLCNGQGPDHPPMVPDTDDGRLISQSVDTRPFSTPRPGTSGSRFGLVLFRTHARPEDGSRHTDINRAPGDKRSGGSRCVLSFC